MSLEHPGDDRRCDWCDRPGVPYTYHEQAFSGLCPCEGERLCPTCVEEYLRRKRDEPVGWAQVPAREYVTPRLA